MSEATQERPKIHRLMTIKDILSMFPHQAQRLSQEITNAGLHCIGCNAASYETLEAGMMSHGFGETEIGRLEERLNTLLEEKFDLGTISMTERAAKKFLEILESEGKQGWSLRFGDRAAGCSGFEYELGYSEKTEADDEIFENFGVQIHVNKVSAKRLRGSLIDYVDGLQGSGFKISNPNARSSCGCGSSHGY